jgi:hypothetical protein
MDQVFRWVIKLSETYKRYNANRFIISIPLFITKADDF